MGILNTNGYYDKLLEFLDYTVAQGFTRAEVRNHIVVEKTPHALLTAMMS